MRSLVGEAGVGGLAHERVAEGVLALAVEGGVRARGDHLALRELGQPLVGLGRSIGAEERGTPPAPEGLTEDARARGARAAPRGRAARAAPAPSPAPSPAAPSPRRPRRPRGSAPRGRRRCPPALRRGAAPRRRRRPRRAPARTSRSQAFVRELPEPDLADARAPPRAGEERRAPRAARARGPCSGLSCEVRRAASKNCTVGRSPQWRSSRTRSTRLGVALGREEVLEGAAHLVAHEHRVSAARRGAARSRRRGRGCPRARRGTRRRARRRRPADVARDARAELLPPRPRGARRRAGRRRGGAACASMPKGEPALIGSPRPTQTRRRRRALCRRRRNSWRRRDLPDAGGRRDEHRARDRAPRSRTRSKMATSDGELALAADAGGGLAEERARRLRSASRSPRSTRAAVGPAATRRSARRGAQR